MNIPRKVTALRRDLRRHEEEIEHVAKQQAAGDENVLALPRFVDKYLADIRGSIEELRPKYKLEAEK